MTNLKISKSVFELLNNCGIRSYPIRIKTLTRSDYFKENNIFFDTYQNLEKYKRKLSMLFTSRDGVSLRFYEAGFTIVFYNAELYPPGRVNWTIIHELGHIFLKHESYNKQTEAEADLFAKLFLCHPLVLSSLKVDKAADIKKLCGISLEAAKNRERELAVLNPVYNEWDYKINSLFNLPL